MPGYRWLLLSEGVTGGSPHRISSCRSLIHFEMCGAFYVDRAGGVPANDTDASGFIEVYDPTRRGAVGPLCRIQARLSRFRRRAVLQALFSFNESGSAPEKGLRLGGGA